MESLVTSPRTATFFRPELVGAAFCISFIMRSYSGSDRATPAIAVATATAMAQGKRLAKLAVSSNAMAIALMGARTDAAKNADMHSMTMLPAYSAGRPHSAHTLTNIAPSMPPIAIMGINSPPVAPLPLATAVVTNRATSRAKSIHSAAPWNADSRVFSPLPTVLNNAKPTAHVNRNAGKSRNVLLFILENDLPSTAIAQLNATANAAVTAPHTAAMPHTEKNTPTSAYWVCARKGSMDAPARMPME